MEVIRNPWEKKFLSFVSQSRKSIKIASPYIKNSSVTKLLKLRKPKTILKLINSFTNYNYANNSSDFKALEQIIKARGIIKNLPSLHAKIYIFDDTRAVVTSANLTYNGLNANYEYGILVEEEKIVSNISKDFDKIFADPELGFVKQRHIDIKRKLIRNLPTRIRESIEKFPSEETMIEYPKYPGGVDSIVKSLSGWKLEVFNCLLEMGKDKFELKDIYKYEKELELKYPNNTKIKDKIRQQLQELRDVGLLEFTSRGKYKTLWE